MEKRLCFVPSYLDFEKDGILATPEMVDYNTWPLMNGKGKPINPAIQKIYKDIFNAVMELNSFSTKISIEVNEEEKYFILSDVVCLRIYYGNTCIAAFDGHEIVKSTKQPRLSVLDWQEITRISPTGKEEPTDEAFEKTMVEEAEKTLIQINNWSSAERWKAFFQFRISKFGIGLVEEGSSLITEADKKIRTGQNILFAVYEAENIRNPK